MLPTFPTLHIFCSRTIIESSVLASLPCTEFRTGRVIVAVVCGLFPKFSGSNLNKILKLINKRTLLLHRYSKQLSSPVHLEYRYIIMRFQQPKVGSASSRHVPYGSYVSDTVPKLSGGKGKTSARFSQYACTNSITIKTPWLSTCVIWKLSRPAEAQPECNRTRPSLNSGHGTLGKDSPDGVRFRGVIQNSVGVDAMSWYFILTTAYLT